MQAPRAIQTDASTAFGRFRAKAGPDAGILSANDPRTAAWRAGGGSGEFTGLRPVPIGLLTLLATFWVAALDAPPPRKLQAG